MYTATISTILVPLVFLLVRFPIWQAERAAGHSPEPVNHFLNVVGMGVLGCSVGSLIATVLGQMAMLVTVKTMPAVQLASMRTQGNLSGTFLLGSGGVNSYKTYNFYVKNQDGSLTPDQVASGPLVHITEDADLHDTGFLLTQVEITSLDNRPMLANWAYGEARTKVLRQSFHVPPGTVVTSFKAD